MPSIEKNTDTLLKKKIKKFLFIRPNDLKYYKLAFFHSSLSSDTDDRLNNERLEFLGDSILSSVVTKLLFLQYPDKREGFLTEIKTRYIKREHLDKVGKRLGLHHFLNYKGNFNFEHQHILGNTFEALIGAIFLDKGFDAVTEFWEKLVTEKIIDTEEIQQDINYKGELINYSQKNDIQLQFLDEELQENKEHFFLATIILNGEVISEGKGISKKDAQKEAAKIAYLKLIAHDSH
ncbi:MAG: ribonuclease III [Bacteroidales bacterium]|nr:ribonuclease III [Bacteroidales bacterium]